MSGSIVLALRLITALVLFGFLGWALYYLYREVHRQSASIASRRVPGISIAIRHEPGKSILKHFSQPEIILGRDPGSDIPLMDDTASARHALLSYHHTQWWLEDLTSTNGTFLNNLPITMPTVITSGDEIRCGGTSLTITLSENIIVEPTLRIGKKP
ncbi:MAG: FHA domain-containing protein [Anaerolineales bacterium]|nr:FHA domain-containing protein [Anaerolineales bacterium]